MRNLLESIFEFLMNRIGNEPSSSSHFQQRNTFLHRTTCDAEKILRSGLVKRPLPSAMLAAMESAPIELINKKAVTPGKLLSELANVISEIDGFLIDDQFLECESHEDKSRKWKVESRPSRAEKVVRSTHYFLGSSLYSRSESGRADSNR